MSGRNVIPIPSREELVSSLEYRHQDGALLWKKPPFLGKEAGHKCKLGYIAIRLNYKLYLAHRLVWKLFNDEDVDQIDHINNIKTDNRICNLRPASSPQNCSNRLLTKSNTSGYKGVSWYKALGKWKAAITLNYKTIHIGYFSCPEAAHAAYLKAAQEIQGEFYNSGRRV